ncbi:coiled-coil domain-containing protein 32 isoform X2 [Nannospalax galili]|uniref:coiled-coil domain-containing protein 32 isoform X2 n=1 Tax=Nannospalax galili TaxID=1026970 RepID=UPI0004ECFF4A|nr:coiled-coil domain-containing protein 32 isoform X2 [Nannospalax galili]
MKMFESLDSTATKSGRDLWAEICSCLPSPAQEDVANNVFSDSFMDSHPEEKKLRRIKGLNEEVTSKDMLRTLAQAKKECWDRFLQEKLSSEFFVDGLDSDESTLEHFKRWLQPDKVAVSTEEVQFLIPPESQAEKPETGDKPAAAEQ